MTSEDTHIIDIQEHSEPSLEDPVEKFLRNIIRDEMRHEFGQNNDELMARFEDILDKKMQCCGLVLVKEWLSNLCNKCFCKQNSRE
jgi:hypothetical protein